MAKQEEDAAAAKVETAKIPMLSLLLTVTVAVGLAVAAVGGAGFWLVKSGRLPVVQGASRAEAVKAEPAKTRLVPLDPLLVNLADDGGRSYLRVAMTLRVEEPPPAKGEKPKEEKPGKPAPNENEAALRDAALDVLGRQSGAALLQPEAKEKLKDELLASLKLRVPEAKVTAVLFTEFLVQR